MSKKDVRESSSEMDMTPMIDCVFQLIIFFFLVIDLQNQELEPVLLPKARFAVPDQPPEGQRPIVNVLQSGETIYKRKTYLEADATDYSRLQGLLEYFAKNMTKKFVPAVKKELPDDPLLIRADKWTEMHHVAKIMETCGHLNVQIWRVELAVGEPKAGSEGAAKAFGTGN